MRHALRRFVPLTVLALVVLAGCTALGGSGRHTGSTTGFANASLSYFEAMGGCGGTANQNAGWLYWSANGERYAVAFNASLAGTSAVNASLSHTQTGDYTLTLTPTEGPQKAGTPGPTCDPTTPFDVSASVPNDFRSFRVVYAGRTLAVAHNDGDTTGHLIDLPTPVNRTAT